MARSAIHEVVKSVFRESATRLRQQGPEFDAAAAHLEQASTHWVRHTAGSHLSEKADIKVVRDNLGHANICTTGIYLHSEDDARLILHPYLRTRSLRSLAPIFHAERGAVARSGIA
jgi:integrase/recombinase XerD